MRLLYPVIGLFMLGLASESHAGSDAAWPFDLNTTGEDVTWDSSTALDSAAGRYRFEYIITMAEADASFSGIPLGTFDIFGMLSPEQQSDIGFALGPAPVVVWNSSIIAPDPPESPAVSADVQINVDAAGFAHMSMSNVFLGTTMFDAGPPFGVVPVTITRLRMAGTILGDAIELTSDLNNDCLVDAADLGVILSQFGSDNEQGDINDDNVVDAADLGLLLNQFGSACQ